MTITNQDRPEQSRSMWEVFPEEFDDVAGGTGDYKLSVKLLEDQGSSKPKVGLGLDLTLKLDSTTIKSDTDLTFKPGDDLEASTSASVSTKIGDITISCGGGLSTASGVSAECSASGTF